MTAPRCEHCGVLLVENVCPNTSCDGRGRMDDPNGLRAFLEHHRRRVQVTGWTVA